MALTPLTSKVIMVMQDASETHGHVKKVKAWLTLLSYIIGEADGVDGSAPAIPAAKS